MRETILSGGLEHDLLFANKRSVEKDARLLTVLIAKVPFNFNQGDRSIWRLFEKKILGS